MIRPTDAEPFPPEPPRISGNAALAAAVAKNATQPKLPLDWNPVIWERFNWKRSK